MMRARRRVTLPWCALPTPARRSRHSRSRPRLPVLYKQPSPQSQNTQTAASPAAPGSVKHLQDAFSSLSLGILPVMRTRQRVMVPWSARMGTSRK